MLWLRGHMSHPLGEFLRKFDLCRRTSSYVTATDLDTKKNQSGNRSDGGNYFTYAPEVFNLHCLHSILRMPQLFTHTYRNNTIGRSRLLAVFALILPQTANVGVSQDLP
jgi:hypothetical protein